MTRLICDASCLRNMFYVDLELQMLGLPYRLEVFTQVVRELRKKYQRRIDGMIRRGLNVVRLSGQENEEMKSRERDGLQIGFPDRAQLVYAEGKPGCILLTGDAEMRVIAMAAGIYVHGSIWLIRRMLAEGIATRTELLGAAEKWNQSPETWLPSAELSELITELRQHPE